MAAIPRGEPNQMLATRAPATHGVWDAHRYLAEYYSRVEPTEHHTLRFVVEALKLLRPGALALEFGCGPTVHHLLPLAARVAEIHVADLLPDNIRIVRGWQTGAADAHDWSPFTRETLRLEGNSNPTAHHVFEREDLVRRRVTRALIGDARLEEPLGPAHSGRYDCVLSCFCADSATGSLAEWMRYTRNIASLLAPSGLLVLAALRQCKFYSVGGIQFPSPCIDERHVQLALDAAGFGRSGQVIEVAEVPDQREHGFECIVMASAIG